MLKMTRSDEVNGDIYIRVYHDGLCIKAFYARDETELPNAEHAAEVFYDECAERLANGYPKEITLKQTETKQP